MMWSQVQQQPSRSQPSSPTRQASSPIQGSTTARRTSRSPSPSKPTVQPITPIRPSLSVTGLPPHSPAQYRRSRSASPPAHQPSASPMGSSQPWGFTASRTPADNSGAADDPAHETARSQVAAASRRDSVRSRVDGAPQTALHLLSFPRDEGDTEGKADEARPYPPRGHTALSDPAYRLYLALAAAPRARQQSTVPRSGSAMAGSHRRAGGRVSPRSADGVSGGVAGRAASGADVQGGARQAHYLRPTQSSRQHEAAPTVGTQYQRKRPGRMVRPQRPGGAVPREAAATGGGASAGRKRTAYSRMVAVDTGRLNKLLQAHESRAGSEASVSLPQGRSDAVNRLGADQPAVVPATATNVPSVRKIMSPLPKL